MRAGKIMALVTGAVADAGPRRVGGRTMTRLVVAAFLVARGSTS